MKNPFIKPNNNALIISVAVGSVAAGVAAYLVLTTKGIQLRRQIVDYLGNWFQSKEPVVKDATAYLKKPHLEPKSDREELLHNGPIPERPGL